MRVVSLFIGSFFLAACALGPDYSRPDLSPPASFRSAEAQVEAESFANLPWWDLLQDQALQTLIQTALKENKDLKRAVASVEEFQARLLVAKMDFAPKADITGNAPLMGRKAEFLFPGFPNPFNYYLQGNLAWELDIWGRIRRSMKRRAAISWPARKPGAPWSCSSSAASLNPISTSCSSIGNWRSPGARCNHGKNR